MATPTAPRALPCPAPCARRPAPCALSRPAPRAPPSMPAPDLRARQALRAHPSPQTAARRPAPAQTAARRPALPLPGATRPRSSSSSRGLAGRLRRPACSATRGGTGLPAFRAGRADDRLRWLAGRARGPQPCGRERSMPVGPPAANARPVCVCWLGSEHPTQCVTSPSPPSLDALLQLSRRIGSPYKSLMEKKPSYQDG